jgi:ABC-2 type transport system permease protein
MTGAIRSELRKLLTLRTTYLLAAGAAAIAVFTVVGSGAGAAIDTGTALPEQQSYLFTTLLTRLVFVLVGIRVITEEYRYGTITPSLLATGSRLRLLIAKLAAAATAAIVMALLAQLALVVALTLLGEQTTPGPLVTADAASALGGMLGAAALFAALGVALGMLVRQPVPATVGAVVWLLLGEDLLQVRFGEAVEYLPGYAGLALAGAAEATSVAPALGGMVLAGWVTAVLLPAALLLRRRDVG